MNTSKSNLRRRVGRVLAAGAITTVGATGVALGLAGAAGAQTTQTNTVNESYTCDLLLNGGTISSGQALTAPVTVTGPVSEPVGTTFDVSAVSSVSLPSSLTSVLPSLGATGVTVNSVDVDVTATDVTPASATDTAEGVPFSLTDAQITSAPITATLTPLPFTGTAAGTATFTAGDLSAAVTVVGGTFAGDSAGINCTPNTGNPLLGSVTITSGTSTVPVGAVGGAALAGVLGVGGMGTYVARRRRTPIVPDGTH